MSSADHLKSSSVVRTQQGRKPRPAASPSIPLASMGTANKGPSSRSLPKESSSGRSTALPKNGRDGRPANPKVQVDASTVADAVPEVAANNVSGASSRFAFLRRLDFISILVAVILGIPAFVTLAPTFASRHVDDERLRLDHLKASGDFWSRYVTFRQECLKEQDAARALSSACVAVLSQPLATPPELEGVALIEEHADQGGLTIIMTSVEIEPVGEIAEIAGAEEVAEIGAGEGRAPRNMNDEEEADEKPARSGRFMTEEERDLVMTSFVDFMNRCQAEKDANRHLLEECTEAIDVGERILRREANITMSEGLLRLLPRYYF
ncbi:hypothetical protein BR93DRAFT_969088 [Coniochaeta sp. PMI_546]|nr:hypothetical protein BR93DRAFT_969088 [Coniochaeta sp. PMI_546]